MKFVMNPHHVMAYEECSDLCCKTKGLVEPHMQQLMYSQHHLNKNEAHLSIRYAMASTCLLALLPENSKQNQDMQSDLAV